MYLKPCCNLLRKFLPLLGLRMVDYIIKKIQGLQSMTFLRKTMNNQGFRKVYLQAQYNPYIQNQENYDVYIGWRPNGSQFTYLCVSCTKSIKYFYTLFVLQKSNCWMQSSSPPPPTPRTHHPQINLKPVKSVKPLFLIYRPGTFLTNIYLIFYIYVTKANRIN